MLRKIPRLCPARRYHVHIKPKLGHPAHTQLVRLFLAIVECFDGAQIDHIGRALLGACYTVAEYAEVRDAARCLVCTAQQCGRTAQLVERCQQMQPDLAWQTKDVSWLYQSNGLPSHLDTKQLGEILANQFSLQDLRQLCFYLGIAFNDILWWPDPHLWDPETQARYQLWGIDCKALDVSEVETRLKARWAAKFIKLCANQNIWPQMNSVCFHLHPQALQAAAALCLRPIVTAHF